MGKEILISSLSFVDFSSIIISIGRNGITRGMIDLVIYVSLFLSNYHSNIHPYTFSFSISLIIDSSITPTDNDDESSSQESAVYSSNSVFIGNSIYTHIYIVFVQNINILPSLILSTRRQRDRLAHLDKSCS